MCWLVRGIIRQKRRFFFGPAALLSSTCFSSSRRRFAAWSTVSGGAGVALDVFAMAGGDGDVGFEFEFDDDKLRGRFDERGAVGEGEEDVSLSDAVDSLSLLFLVEAV